MIGKICLELVSLTISGKLLFLISSILTDIAGFSLNFREDGKNCEVGGC